MCDCTHEDRIHDSRGCLGWKYPEPGDRRRNPRRCACRARKATASAFTHELDTDGIAVTRALRMLYREHGRSRTPVAR